MNRIYSTYDGHEINRESIIKGMPEPWQPIISKLFDDLFSARWDGHLSQIKEKFGSLRLYLETSTEEMEELIDAAEVETTKVCIECGKPATTTTKGWVTHVCDEHKR